MQNLKFLRLVVFHPVAGLLEFSSILLNKSRARLLWRHLSQKKVVNLYEFSYLQGSLQAFFS